MRDPLEIRYAHPTNADSTHLRTRISLCFAFYSPYPSIHRIRKFGVRADSQWNPWGFEQGDVLLAKAQMTSVTRCPSCGHAASMHYKDGACPRWANKRLDQTFRILVRVGK